MSGRLVIRRCHGALSLQDGGRRGYQRYGLSGSGAMDRLAMAVVGVGAISANATVFREGFIAPGKLEEIRAHGAVGTICGRFFGKDGRPVGTEFDDRTLSISLERLARVPLAIAAALSPLKAEAIRAAVSGGLVNAVATDVETAEALMALPPSHC